MLRNDYIGGRIIRGWKMSKNVDKIDYDKLLEKALVHVVVEALKIVERQGLPGDHHFYLTFRTDHPRTEIDDFLKEQYPHEMTIVLQNQFENLHVEEDSFSVVLRFSRVPYQLKIPFDAITYFGDNDLVDVKPSMFTVPMPTEDVVANPNMASDVPPIRVNIRETYSYDF